MEEGEVQQYPRIFLGKSEGVFSISSGGLRWKSVNTDTDKKLGKDDITTASWTNLRRESILHILTKEGDGLRFDGFSKDDLALFAELFRKQFEVKLDVTEPACTGFNWGDMNVRGGALTFALDGKAVMDVPLTVVSQCVLPGNSRNEVELQFHEDDTAERDDDTLVEMRLYIPPGEEDISGAESFQQMILDRADIRKEVGQSIVELDEEIGTFLTPRGRYAIEMYGTFLRMHGKTYDYKILYHSISRLFLLSKPDKYHVAFVISLEDPIRQGKQVYQHLVMHLVRDEIEIPVNLSEDVLKDKYEGNLSQMMSGQLPDVVAKVFKALTGKKVFVPGNFRTSAGDSAIKCALKASEGFLYPLEKSFLFIHKPVTFIKFEDIDYVEFQRYTGQTTGTASRNFDLHVQCKAVGGEPGREFSFSAVDRKEYQPLIDFLTTKKSIKIKNLRAEDAEGAKPLEEYRHDPYKAALDAMGSDDDDESDSDFGPGEDESESDGEDDDEEEEDDGSDFSEVSDEDKPKKSPKKRKRAEGNGDESKKGKKQKKTKDPSAPKKATSAFMFFSQEMRPKLVKEHPDLGFGDVAKKVGQLWAELGDDEKKVYTAKAEEDKKRYEKESENYKPPKGSPKSGNAPKRAKSAFVLFSTAKRQELKSKSPKASFTDLSKEIGSLWQALPADEKKVWEKKAAEEKAKGPAPSPKSTPRASKSKDKPAKKKKKEESSEEEESEEESAQSSEEESESDASD